MMVNVEELEFRLLINFSAASGVLNFEHGDVWREHARVPCTVPAHVFISTTQEEDSLRLHGWLEELNIRQRFFGDGSINSSLSRGRS